MSTPPPVPGSICWIDLTVPNADAVRDFYERVAGWAPVPIDMGGYADYAMQPAGAERPVAGVCHARGMNADIPPLWLIYIMVDNADAAAQRAVEQGGSVVCAPRTMGPGRMAVIRDPAGAVCGLYQPLA